jgi:hypothetical protein
MSFFFSNSGAEESNGFNWSLCGSNAINKSLQLLPNVTKVTTDLNTTPKLQQNTVTPQH